MGFIFMMIIPLVVIFMQENDNMEKEIAISSAAKISKELIDAAEEIYYKGPPSKTTIKVNFPKRITNITISSKEISMKIMASKGIINEISYPSEINLSGTLEIFSGLHIIEIESKGEYVSIGEK